jgi:hypothetical protein
MRFRNFIRLALASAVSVAALQSMTAIAQDQMCRRGRTLEWQLPKGTMRERVSEGYRDVG